MPGRFETAARRWTWGVAALACVIVAEPTEGEDGDYRVYRATDTIRFERHCANAEAYQVQAWAELGSEGGRVRALVLIYARHDAVRRDDIFIGFRLVALHMGAGEGAAHAPWSIRMEARSAGGGYVGVEHAAYDSNPARGEGGGRRGNPVPWTTTEFRCR